MQMWAYNDSDDAGYWVEQERRLREGHDPRVLLAATLDKIDRYRANGDPALVRRADELETHAADLRLLVEAMTLADDLHAENNWTREMTIERRAAWNAAVRDKKYAPKGAILIGTIERDLGFTIQNLKHYVKHYGL